MKGGRGAAFPFLLLLLAPKISLALSGARSLFPVSHSLLDLLLGWEVGVPLSAEAVVSLPSLSSELAGGGDEVDLSLTEGLPGEFKARSFPWVCLHLLQGKPFPHSLAGGGGRGRIYFPKS